MNFYIISNSTCFDASSSGSLIVYMLKLQNQYGYEINKINRLKCLYRPSLKTIAILDVVSCINYYSCNIRMLLTWWLHIRTTVKILKFAMGVILQFCSSELGAYFSTPSAPMVA